MKGNWRPIFIVLILPCLLSLVNGTNGETGAVMCPSDPEWRHRSVEYCYTNPDQYHCLQLQTGDGYVEMCRDNILIPKGYFPLWSSAAKSIYKAECPNERYQPADTTSNKLFQCKSEKSICNEQGELTYSDGTTSTDRSCRCDYKAGYLANLYAYTNEKNLTYYFPKQVHRGCTKLDCGPGKELDPAYRCVPKCKDGYFRPELQFYCVQNPSVTSPNATTETKRTTETPIPSAPPKQDPTTPLPVAPPADVPKKGSITAVVVVCVIIGTMVVIAFFSLHAWIREHESHAKYGEKFTLHCVIRPTICIGDPQCEWFRVSAYDVETLIDEEDESYHIRALHTRDDEGIMVSELTIKKATESTEGTYRCVVSNLWRKSSAETAFNVAGGGPTIETPNKESKPIYPDIAGDFRHADSSVPNTPKVPHKNGPTNIYYIEKYYEGPETNIEKAGNVVIGDRGKIVSYTKSPLSGKSPSRSGKSSSQSRGDFSDSSDDSRRNDDQTKQRRPRTGKKKKKEKRSPVRTSSDGGDTTGTESEERKPLVKGEERGPAVDGGGDASSRLNGLQEYKRCKMVLDELARMKYRLKIEDVPGDGSCLYHAIHKVLSFHHPTLVQNLNAVELRRQLIKFFESNPSMPNGGDFKDFLCLPLDNDRGMIQPEDMYIEQEVSDVGDQKALRWERFLKKIDGGEWGGDLEIQGIAQNFQVEIGVLCLNPREDDLLEYTFDGGNAQSHQRVRIGHIRVDNKGFHFVAMLPEDGERQLAPKKDPVQQEIRSIHLTLVDKIAQTIFVGSEELVRLKTLLVPFLEPVDRQADTTFQQLCDALIRKEEISIGEYDFLKQRLRHLELVKLAKSCEDAEEEIKVLRDNNKSEKESEK